LLPHAFLGNLSKLVLGAAAGGIEMGMVQDHDGLFVVDDGLLLLLLLLLLLSAKRK